MPHTDFALILDVYCRELVLKGFYNKAVSDIHFQAADVKKRRYQTSRFPNDAIPCLDLVSMNPVFRQQKCGQIKIQPC